MTEEDFLERTELPTPKKLAEAKEKGIVAKSTDMTTSAVLFCTILLFFMSSFSFYNELREMTLGIWNNLNFVYDDISVISYYTTLGLWKFGKVLAWPILGVLASAILINILQSGFIFAPAQLRPRWYNLNVFYAGNYKKYFSTQTLVRALFGQLKIFFVVYVTWKWIESDLDTIYHLTYAPTQTVFDYLAKKTFFLGVFLAAAYFVLSIFDLGYQKWQFIQDMKMSPHEIREERRQAEGNIQWKPRVLEERRQLYEGRAVNISKADFLLVGNQPYAMAFQYQPGKMLAPVCVMRGSKQKAENMKKNAVHFGIPIIEDNTLALGLFYESREGRAISPKYYYPIAKILSSTKR